MWRLASASSGQSRLVLLARAATAHHSFRSCTAVSVSARSPSLSSSSFFKIAPAAQSLVSSRRLYSKDASSSSSKTSSNKTSSNKTNIKTRSFKGIKDEDVEFLSEGFEDPHVKVNRLVKHLSERDQRPRVLAYEELTHRFEKNSRENMAFDEKGPQAVRDLYWNVEDKEQPPGGWRPLHEQATHYTLSAQPIAIGKIFSTSPTGGANTSPPTAIGAAIANATGAKNQPKARDDFGSLDLSMFDPVDRIAVCNGLFIHDLSPVALFWYKLFKAHAQLPSDSSSDSTASTTSSSTTTTTTTTTAALPREKLEMNEMRKIELTPAVIVRFAAWILVQHAIKMPFLTWLTRIGHTSVVRRIKEERLKVAMRQAKGNIAKGYWNRYADQNVPFTLPNESQLQQDALLFSNLNERVQFLDQSGPQHHESDSADSENTLAEIDEKRRKHRLFRDPHPRDAHEMFSENEADELDEFLNEIFEDIGYSEEEANDMISDITPDQLQTITMNIPRAADFARRSGLIKTTADSELLEHIIRNEDLNKYMDAFDVAQDYMKSMDNSQPKSEAEGDQYDEQMSNDEDEEVDESEEDEEDSNYKHPELFGEFEFRSGERGTSGTDESPAPSVLHSAKPNRISERFLKNPTAETAQNMKEKLFPANFSQRRLASAQQLEDSIRQQQSQPLPGDPVEEFFSTYDPEAERERGQKRVAREDDEMDELDEIDISDADENVSESLEASKEDGPHSSDFDASLTDETSSDSAMASIGGVPSDSAMTSTGGVPSDSAMASTGGVPSDSAMASTGGAPSDSAMASTGGAPSDSAMTSTGGAPSDSAMTSTSDTEHPTESDALISDNPDALEIPDRDVLDMPSDDIPSDPVNAIDIEKEMNDPNLISLLEQYAKKHDSELLTEESESGTDAAPILAPKKLSSGKKMEKWRQLISAAKSKQPPVSADDLTRINTSFEATFEQSLRDLYQSMIHTPEFHDVLPQKIQQQFGKVLLQHSRSFAPGVKPHAGNVFRMAGEDSNDFPGMRNVFSDEAQLPLLKERLLHEGASSKLIPQEMQTNLLRHGPEHLPFVTSEEIEKSTFGISLMRENQWNPDSFTGFNDDEVYPNTAPEAPPSFEEDFIYELDEELDEPGRTPENPFKGPDVFLDDFEETILETRTVRGVTAQGRTNSYRVIMIVGNYHGACGWGIGQGKEVSRAIDSARRRAHENIMSIGKPEAMLQYTIKAKYNASKVIMTPNKYGVVAAPWLLKPLHYFGIGGITVKTLGSRNRMNIMRAFFNGMSMFMDEETTNKANGVTPTSALSPYFKQLEALRVNKGAYNLR